MWIVQLALKRPYTFIVAAILILVLGLTSIATTPTDAALTGSKMPLLINPSPASG